MTLAEARTLADVLSALDVPIVKAAIVHRLNGAFPAFHWTLDAKRVRIMVFQVHPPRREPYDGDDEC